MNHLSDGKKIGKALKPPKAVPISEFGLEMKKKQLVEKDSGSLSGRESIIAYMSAWGMTDREMSESLEMARQNVTETRNRDHVKKQIAAIKQRIFERDPKRMLKEYLPRAIITATEIMTDPLVKPGVRLNAAQDIMDRNLGKAAQKIEVEHTNLRALMEKLDRHEIDGSLPDVLAESRDVTDAEVVTAPVEEKDLADRWAEEHLCVKNSSG